MKILKFLGTQPMVLLTKRLAFIPFELRQVNKKSEFKPLNNRGGDSDVGDGCWGQNVLVINLRC